MQVCAAVTPGAPQAVVVEQGQESVRDGSFDHLSMPQVFAAPGAWPMCPISKPQRTQPAGPVAAAKAAGPVAAAGTAITSTTIPTGPIEATSR